MKHGIMMLEHANHILGNHENEKLLNANNIS
jgi:hypothetical protein